MRGIQTVWNHIIMVYCIEQVITSFTTCINHVLNISTLQFKGHGYIPVAWDLQCNYNYATHMTIDKINTCKGYLQLFAPLHQSRRGKDDECRSNE